MCTEMPHTEADPQPNDRFERRDAALYFTIPSELSKFCLRGGNLEALKEKLIQHAVSICHSSGSVRVGVHERKKLSDLEDFFALSPLYWFQLSLE